MPYLWRPLLSTGYIVRNWRLKFASVKLFYTWSILSPQCGIDNERTSDYASAINIIIFNIIGMNYIRV
jgi:hypothetical protein